MATFWAFLIYWLVVFVGCYIVIEIAQDQLYDEVTPRVGLKVTAGSFLIAAMLAAFYHRQASASFDTMFTTNFMWTVLQAIVWFAVFTLVFQFHPWHALGLGLATMLLIQGLATMGVNSMLAPTPATAKSPASAVSKPVRQSLAPAAPPAAAPKEGAATPKAQ
ncbi:hypothetical protein OJF2_48410 [Aquisphaera giovannonii]|uniref:Uncharacterized protein n=1 Tax=Aquisphaera giovannonii TaxID=406548 RepID=A0A5B9W8E5_9BACT|nr:hypothetical protein [Aquisphaera giovannonii]QEH36281.1 hypothetical protein OJF2_48410 [Aquisphaera giovannonii]